MSIWSAIVDVATDVAAAAASNLPGGGAATLSTQVKIFGAGAGTIAAAGEAEAHNHSGYVAVVATSIGIAAGFAVPGVAASAVATAALPYLGALGISITLPALTTIVAAGLAAGAGAVAASLSEWGIGELIKKLGGDDPAYPLDPANVPDTLLPKSPLVLDTNLSGSIELSALGDTITYFDLDADGQAELTAWVADGDGLLVRAGENDKVDDISELFGSADEDGFTALRDLDTNTDGRITDADNDWDELSVWIDSNADGVTQEGELHTLDELDIVSISLDAALLNETYIADNHVTHASTFQTADGENHQIVDAWFNHNAAITRTVEEFELDSQAAELPTLRGFGTIQHLHIAASIDNGLTDSVLQMLTDLSDGITNYTSPAEVFSNWAQIESDVEDLLLKWAGVEDVNPTSRGSHVDARYLEFYEAFTGRPFTQYNQPDPLIEAGRFVEAMFDYIKTYYATQIVAQIIGADIFDDAPYYDIFSGTMQGDMVLSQDGIDAVEAEAIAGDAVAVWTQFARFIGYTKGLDNLTTAETTALDTAITNTNEPSLADWADVVTTMIANLGPIIDSSDDWGSFEVYYDDGVNGTSGADTLTGQDGVNDHIVGLNGNDTLSGLSGHDRLDGGNGDDILDGGSGDDLLLGGSNNDTFVWSQGDDTFNDTGGTDELQIASSTGLTSSNIADIFRSGNNLVLQLSTGALLTIDAHFSSSANRIETIRFMADNSTVSTSAIPTLNTYGTASSETLSVHSAATGNALHGFGGNDVLLGGSGNDNLYGGSGVDELDGGDGNDLLDGGSGDDLYIVSDGADTISDTGGLLDTLAINYYYDFGLDYVVLQHDPHSIYTSASGDDLTLEFLGSGTEITIENHAVSPVIEWIQLPQYFTSLEFLTPVSLDLAAYQTWTQGTDTSTPDTLTGSYSGTGSTDPYDVIFGYAGNDIIDATGGYNIVLAGSGDDTVDGGSNVDILAGGTGNDTLDSAGDDDYVYGDAGDDVIYGGDGDDNLSGGFGADTLYGEDGDDFIYVFDPFQLTYPVDGPVIEESSTNTAFGGAGNDILWGSSGDDDLDGGDDNDELVGGAGADTLTGGNGNDGLDDGDGDDVVNGGDGDDSFIVGAGSDDIIGGNGYDTLTFGDTNGQGVIVNLATSVISEDGFGYEDTVSGIEEVVGTGSEDSITGDIYDNTIVGGAGDDILDGGSGVDWLSFSGYAPNGVTANLSTGVVSDDGRGYTDTVANFENVLGSDRNDTITGDSNANVLSGMAGNDTINGGGGNDTLLGGADDDTFDGGADTDTVNYASAAAGITANLTSGTATGEGSDTFSNIENITGSDFADTLTGDSAGNTLNGGSGDDIIAGRAGADVIDGGADNDTVTYAAAAAGVTVNLSLGTVSNDGDGSSDTISNVENVIGSAYADTITGDSGANIINGGDGGDTINGGDGNDTIIGGTGSEYDDIDGGNGIDTIDYSSSAAGVTAQIIHGVVTDQDALYNIENIIGSAYADNLYGNSGANVIYGGAGVDQIFANEGNDTVYGGDDGDTITGFDGNDTLYGDAGNDSLNGGNHDDTLYGGDGVDSLIGGSGVDTLYGDAGNDTLTAGAGNDILYGGADNDTMDGGGNDDALYGEDGNDNIFGGTGTNTLSGGSGDDTLTGGNGLDTMTGGADADTFAFAVSGAFTYVDTITDFDKTTQNDKLKVTSLLIDFDPLADAITDFVQITDNGTNSFLFVDRDGTAGTYSFGQIATLNNVTGLTDEAALLTSGNLIAA